MDHPNSERVRNSSPHCSTKICVTSLQMREIMYLRLSANDNWIWFVFQIWNLLPDHRHRSASLNVRRHLQICFFTIFFLEYFFRVTAMPFLCNGSSSINLNHCFGLAWSDGCLGRENRFYIICVSWCRRW